MCNDGHRQYDDSLGLVEQPEEQILGYLGHGQEHGPQQGRSCLERDVVEPFDDREYQEALEWIEKGSDQHGPQERAHEELEHKVQRHERQA